MQTRHVRLYSNGERCVEPCCEANKAAIQQALPSTLSHSSTCDRVKQQTHTDQNQLGAKRMELLKSASMADCRTLCITEQAEIDADDVQRHSHGQKQFTIDSGSLEGLYTDDDSIKEPQQPVGHV